jgi:glycerol kinase
MDLETRTWSAECLDVFGIKESALPKILSNSEEYGCMSAGPLAGVPICGCLGDQQAALLGARNILIAGLGCSRFGRAICS